MTDAQFDQLYPTLDIFMEVVKLAMRQELHELINLSNDESNFVEFGFKHKTGARDTAAQIIDNRAEKNST